MKLPNADKAIVSPEKLTNYLLSPVHPVGRFKAAFFRKLGYSAENWKVLERDFRNLILSNDVVDIRETEYGRKFVVEGDLIGPANKRVRVVTVWTIMKEEDIPRFITVYPGG